MIRLLLSFTTALVSVCSMAQTYVKATSISEGDVVLVVCESSKTEFAGCESGRTYGSSASYETSPVGAALLTVEEGNVEGTYAFKLSGGAYLKTSAKNSLTSESELTDNSSWTVTFDNVKGTVSIVNYKYKQDGKDVTLQYNTSSPRFACYSSSQAAVCLYVESSSSSVAKPTFNIGNGTYYANQSVVISHKDKYDVYYTVDGTDPRESATAVKYTSAISVSATTTIKAAAKNGADWSGVATLSVTIPVLDSFRAIQETAKNTAEKYVITFDDAIVTAVSERHAYMVDSEGYGAFVYEADHGFNVGDLVSGSAVGDVLIYNGMFEIQGVTADDLNVVSGQVVPVTETSIGNISIKDQCSVVTLTGLTLKKVNTAGVNVVLTDGFDDITVYKTFMALPEFAADKTYNVTGLVIYHQSTKEIAPRTVNDIVDTATAVESVEVSGGSVSAPCYNLMGQKVGADYKGIVVCGGKKFIKK